MFPLQVALKDRTAVVTGGGGVLCGAMAVELARHGVRVAILNRSADRALEVVQRIVDAGGTAKFFSCDVLRREQLLAARQAIESTFGCCDILINGAGGGSPQGNTTQEILRPEDLARDDVQSFFDITPEGFSHVVDLNLLGTWLPSQVFAKGMLQRPGANILNISSMAASRPATKVPAYSAAKAAIDNLTKWMAVHLADVNIRVNALAPGFFLTDQNRRMLLQPDDTLTDRSRKILDHTPMRRFGQPEDLLGAMLWLVDEQRAGFVTGVTVPIDGGFMAYSGV